MLLESLKKVRRSYRNAIRFTGHWYNAFMDPDPKLVIVVYHQVVDKIIHNPFNTFVSINTFEQQIRRLSNEYPIITLSEAVQQCRSGNIRTDIQVVLTFDDGYKDNYDKVFPILKRFNVPATFFLTTDYVGKDGSLWDWEIFSLLSNQDGPDMLLAGSFKIVRKKGERRTSFAFRAIEAAKSLSRSQLHTLLTTISHIREEMGFPLPNHGFLSWADVQEMSGAGIDFGSHGMTHLSLARLPFEEAMFEIKQSKTVIENRIGRGCIHFSFPFGSSLDYNEQLIEAVKNVGYETCLLNEHGYNHLHKDMLCFRRIIMEESLATRCILG